MNLFLEAIAWIFSSDRLTGSLPLPTAIAQHLGFTFGAVLIASIIAIPAGWAIGHTGRGREIAVGLSGAARALPSLGLLVLLVLLLGVLHKTEAAIVVLVLLAIPSILAGAYAGVEAVDRATIAAGRAVGMTEWQILWRIEVPLGLPLLVGGLRNATLQVVSTVTIAAFIGLGGLGQPILQGIPLRRFDQILGASLVVVCIALALDALLALGQRLVVPRGVAAHARNT
ncbi:ABC transporter permease [Leucobacter sp. GX24907]